MRRQRLPGAVKVSCHEGSACIANYLQSVGSQNHTHKASCHEGSACITHYELQSVGSQNHTHTHTHTHTTESFLEQLLGAVKVSCHEGSACIANYLQSVGSQNHTHTHTTEEFSRRVYYMHEKDRMSFQPKKHGMEAVHL